MAKSVFEGAGNSGDNWDTLQGALVAASNGETITISGTWSAADTTRPFIENSDITIVTDSDSFHGGVWTGTNHYRLENSAVGNCIVVNAANAVIDGIAMLQTSASASDEGVRINAGDNCTVKNCIIWSDSDTAEQDGVFINGPVTTTTIENCSIYGWGRSGVHNNDSTSTANINSCSIFVHASDTTNGAGVLNTASTSVTINVFNTVVMLESGHHADARCFRDNGIATWQIDNCMDDDASITARDSGAVGALESRIIREATSGGAEYLVTDITGITTYDVSLVDDSTNNDAQNAHSATSGATLSLPTFDITGFPRDTSSGNIDVGAYAAEGPSPLVLYTSPGLSVTNP